MATKPRSKSAFSTELAVRVAFRSVHGQFWTGTGFAGVLSEGLGRGAVQGQQQPEVPALEQFAPFPAATFPEGWMANMQHHPCGNARVRLQARTRVRRMRLFIIYQATDFSSTGQVIYPGNYLGEVVATFFHPASCVGVGSSARLVAVWRVRNLKRLGLQGETEPLLSGSRISIHRFSGDGGGNPGSFFGGTPRRTAWIVGAGFRGAA